MHDELTRYLALLRTQTDERVRNTLREMIREIEEGVACARFASRSYRRTDERMAGGKGD